MFDYGNARLRARISRMLSMESLESYANIKSIDRLISILIKTKYQRSIEHALTITQGLACLQEAFDYELEQMNNDLSKFYQSEANREIKILLKLQDLRNIKVILRGIHRNVEPEEIIGSLSGLGRIPINILTQLAHSISLQELLSKMLIFHLDESEPLFLHTTEINNMDFPKLETILEKWFFENMLKKLSGKQDRTGLIREYFAIEADVTNLNTALRFLTFPESKIVVRENIEDFFVDLGHISKRELKQISEKNDLSTIKFKVNYSEYNPYLLRAQENYKQDHQLSHFDYEMESYKVNWAAKLTYRNPLGIGVPISFLVRKLNEIRNLRWISYGINFGIQPDNIKANLMRVF
jgi:vacuolar-type H+-ATPase subunit C/Vma6